MYRSLPWNVCVLSLCACAGSLEPDGATGDFVGAYVASTEIGRACQGVSAVTIDEAGEIAAQTDGVGQQAVLASLYYSKTDWLEWKGRSTLAQRGVKPEPPALCRFGNSVAGQDDPIGRFLRPG